MHIISELLSIDKDSETPIYLQITNAVVHRIRSGHLRRGLKLPGSRELASLLHIHRKTLQTAYEELMAQGWVEILPRKGTFVVKDLPEIKPRKITAQGQLTRYPDTTAFSLDKKTQIQFPPINTRKAESLVIDDGFPDVRLAPAELLMREFRRLATHSAFKRYSGYGSPQGPAFLLDTLATFLGDTRGLPITSSNVMITKGATMGIYLAGKLLIKPGDHVIVGEPGFFAANVILQHAGAVLNRVPVDDSGIDVDKIELLCRRKTIRLLYVVPHHHYPTTVTLTPERRIRLLELGARYKFAIIEDDYDYDFHYNSSPVLPMASLDHHGNVIYIGTLSKTLAPAIRVGFVVAPANFIAAMSNQRRAIDWQGDTMMEVAIAELYRNGTMGRHIKKVVKLYRERRDYFCELLKERIGERISFKIPDGGMSVWTRFNDVDLPEVAERAATKGLTLSDGRLHNTGTKNYNATRLGFASLNLSEQEKAVEILSDSI